MNAEHRRFVTIARGRGSRFPFVIAAVLTALAVNACGSSTTTSTAPSPITRCGVTLAVTDSTVPPEGGTGRIMVATARECAWSATSEATWLSIVGTNGGQGDGSIEYRATSNPDPVVRRGMVALNDQRAEISQAASQCVIQLREPSASLPQTGGPGTVNVIASSALCTWTAASDADWITLTSGANGKGTAPISFSVAPTSGPPRTGTITVAGQRFSVTQSQGCTYSIAPTSASMGASGGDGTIAITTGAGCPWTAGSNVDWITVTEGAGGNGPGTVAFTVAGTAGPARTGTMVVAGQSFTVNQSPGCSYEVTPTTHAFGSAGGTGRVTVGSTIGCGWNATANAPWININGATSGSGDGAVTFSVAPADGPPRDGTLTIAGQTVTVSQSQGCSYTIAPENQSVPSSGGGGTVNVTAGEGCSWNASSNANWLSITEGSSGSGNGTVRFNASAASGPGRSGTLTIAGRTFTVNQGEGCTFSLSATSMNAPSVGATGSVDVTTAGGCTWTATVASNVNWITIAAGANGSGNGRVEFVVLPNSGPARSGTLTIAGRTFTVNQAAGTVACTYSISPQQQSVAAGGGTVTVNVLAAAGCGWSSSSNASWISVNNGSGTGNGNLQLIVAANTGAARTGTTTIAGQTFTVNQAAGCTYSVNPTSRNASASGGDDSFDVDTTSNCSWTAVPDVPWITIRGNPSGTGDGDVDYRVQANTGPQRTGRIVVQGAIFTVNQAGGCTYSLSATSQTVPRTGGPVTVNVLAGAGCSWTAVSNVPWITVTSGSSGSGNGTVQFTVLANTTGASRNGTLTIAGQTFTVNQQN